MARPSATAETIVLKLSSAKTISEASFATWDIKHEGLEVTLQGSKLMRTVSGRGHHPMFQE